MPITKKYGLVRASHNFETPLIDYQTVQATSKETWRANGPTIENKAANSSKKLPEMQIS